MGSRKGRIHPFLILPPVLLQEYSTGNLQIHSLFKSRNITPNSSPGEMVSWSFTEERSIVRRESSISGLNFIWNNSIPRKILKFLNQCNNLVQKPASTTTNTNTRTPQ